MKNMGCIISSHNKQILQPSQENNRATAEIKQIALWITNVLLQI